MFNMLLLDLLDLVLCLGLGILALLLFFTAALVFIAGARSIKRELRGGSNHDRKNK